MPPSQPASLDKPDNPAAGYLLAIAGAATAMAVAAAASRWAGLDDLSLVFIVAVLMVASRTRIGPAVLTAVLCFLGYNFFFIEPHYTFVIGSWQGVVTVTLFLAAALVTGRLASTLAMQVSALERAHRHAMARQQLSRQLADAASDTEALEAAVDTLRNAFGGDAWIRLGERSLQQRNSAEEHGWWFEPLQRNGKSLGVMAMHLPAHRGPLDEAQRALVQAIGDELAQTLQRLRLLGELQAERLSSESQRLRNALLSSVSHDLRTPLASIIGAAGSLQGYAHAMSEAERRELLDTVRTEGERLDRYIQNLLDMTRIEHGDLSLQRDWVEAEMVVANSLARLQRQHPGTRVHVEIDRGVGMIWVQSALLEQALFNALDNAVRYSPHGEPVMVDVRIESAQTLVMDVSDRGPGIPAHERERVFDMFYRVERGDRERGGTGLGLAICRGMLEAHGGRAEALAGPEGTGTTIRLTLPLAQPQEAGA